MNDTEQGLNATPQRQTFRIGSADGPRPSLALAMNHFRDESESEDEDVILLSQKRRRKTNNSFVLDLDNKTSASDVIPPSPKRFQFSVNGPKGVYVGVWKLSPERPDSNKHAVFAFIDKNDKMRARVHPEKKDGEKLDRGFPLGAGKSMIGPRDIIYEEYLEDLTHQQRKEYVRIRCTTIRNSEALKDRGRAETEAVLDAIEIASQQEKKGVQEKVTTPTMRSTPKAPSTPKGKRRTGILLGYWKDSKIPVVTDKHAVYGIAQEDNRLRVKVVKETRDGRPMPKCYPEGTGAQWIAFDDIVLEPHLAAVTRLEIKEYARILQKECLDGMSGGEREAAEQMALKKAKAKIESDARATGIDPIRLDAELEAQRRRHNEFRQAAKAKEARTPGLPRAEGQRISQPTSKKREFDAEVTKGSRAEISQADAYRPENKDIPSKRTHLNPENLLSIFKKKDNDLATNPLEPRAPKIDNQLPKAKAKRSSQAEADARAAKIASARTAGARNSDADADARAERMKREREAAFKRAAALGRDAFAKSNAVASDGSVKDQNLKPEYPKTLDSGWDFCQNQETFGAPNRELSDRVKTHNGIKYERRDTGTFAGKLVGDRRDFLTIDGEDYVEYRILMRLA